MSLATKSLIACTVAIAKMDADKLQEVLLDILSSNPSIVLNALIPITAPTFKIVLDRHTTNKIGIIKAFREINGAGLANSKDWSEGMTYGGCPAGTFKVGMTREEADRLAAEINHNGENNHMSSGYSMSATGIKVKVLRDTDQHDYRSLVTWTVEKSGVIPA